LLSVYITLPLSPLYLLFHSVNPSFLSLSPSVYHPSVSSHSLSLSPTLSLISLSVSPPPLHRAAYRLYPLRWVSCEWVSAVYIILTPGMYGPSESQRWTQCGKWTVIGMTCPESLQQAYHRS
jgi:hypothetical protein